MAQIDKIQGLFFKEIGTEVTYIHIKSKGKHQAGWKYLI